MRNSENRRQKGEGINWHAAFFDAIRLELEDYFDVLQFEAEHYLTDEPLRIDVMIIKKADGAIIEKNIGRIFRKENLIEYKSPGDYLSVRDFHKGLAYAHLYSAQSGTDIQEISLTFVTARHPREVLKHIRNAYEWSVKEESGIYRINGDALAIQVIESKRLAEEENLWLRGLSDKLSAESLERVIWAGKAGQRGEYLRAYIYAVAAANMEIMEEVRKMKARTLEEYFEEVGWAAKWEQRGREQGEQRGELRGKELGERSGEQRSKLEVARKALAENLPLTVIQKLTGLSLEQISNLYKEK
jgi:hypothetical protein